MFYSKMAFLYYSKLSIYEIAHLTLTDIEQLFETKILRFYQNKVYYLRLTLRKSVSIRMTLFQGLRIGDLL